MRVGGAQAMSTANGSFDRERLGDVVLDGGESQVLADGFEVGGETGRVVINRVRLGWRDDSLMLGSVVWSAAGLGDPPLRPRDAVICL